MSDLIDNTVAAVRAERVNGDLTVWWETVEALRFNPDTDTPDIPAVMPPWDTGVRLEQMARELAVKVTGGTDVTGFLYRQQELAALLAAGEERDRDAGRQGMDAGGTAAAPHSGGAAAAGGGADLSGAPEDGGAVGQGWFDPGDPGDAEGEAAVPQG